MIHKQIFKIDLLNNQPPSCRIPGHALLSGNELADQAAKEAVLLPPEAGLGVMFLAYVTTLHQSLEQHGSNKPPANFSSSQEGADKFYTPVRAATHVPIHGGVIPIQQPPQGSKTGGITTGYPIRAQPGATTGNYQPVVSSSHNVYVTQAPSTRLLYTSQPNPSQTSQPRYTVQQREI
uniref:Uncharacterized protein n=1 Tax=Timema genevievae TaxID=629358 RepID=A0A7R9PIY1_TIMGE|nr:unnamed protein product [Timema genevievae]